jgi:hypothetical protein
LLAALLSDVLGIAIVAVTAIAASLVVLRHDHSPLLNGCHAILIARR